MLNLLSRAVTGLASSVPKLRPACQEKRTASDKSSSSNTEDMVDGEALVSALKDKFAQEEQKRRAVDERRLDAIKAKLSTGKKLSGAEKEYLKVADPLSYNSYLAAEGERKQYERALLRCKNKEEVTALKMGKLTTSLLNVNNLSNNSAIPQEQKAELIAAENRRIKSVQESTESFEQTQEFKELPTLREEQIYKQEQRKLQKAELSGQKAESREVFSAVEHKTREQQPILHELDYNQQHKLFRVEGKLLTYREIMLRVKKTRQRLALGSQPRQQEPQAADLRPEQEQASTADCKNLQLA